MSYTKASAIGPGHVDQSLTPGQLRILELKDGDSFVLTTIPIVGESDAIPTWQYRDASQIAARLSSWARGRHVQIAYRMIDEGSVRVWRVGGI